MRTYVYQSCFVPSYELSHLVWPMCCLYNSACTFSVLSYPRPLVFIWRVVPSNRLLTGSFNCWHWTRSITGTLHMRSFRWQLRRPQPTSVVGVVRRRLVNDKINKKSGLDCGKQNHRIGSSSLLHKPPGVNVFDFFLQHFQSAGQVSVKQGGSLIQRLNTTGCPTDLQCSVMQLLGPTFRCWSEIFVRFVNDCNWRSWSKIYIFVLNGALFFAWLDEWKSG